MKRQAPSGQAIRFGMSTAVPGVEETPNPSQLVCAERGNPIAVRPVWAGKPTVRRAQFLGGDRMAKKANAGSRKTAGNRDIMAGAFSQPSRITSRIRALVARLERALTWSGEPRRRR